MAHDTTSALQALRESLEGLLRDAGVTAGVHSIQLLTSSGPVLQRPVSYLLSREPVKLARCLRDYTRFDHRTRTFSRSLAAFQIDTVPYLISDIVAPAGIPQAPHLTTPPTLEAIEGWTYTGSATGDPDDYHEWISALGRHFPGLGSTMWITQRCSTTNGGPQSSACVLFSGVVERGQNEQLLFKISKLLRDAVVTEMIGAHEGIIAAQRGMQAALLQKILSEAATDMPLAPDVTKQLRRYGRALQSNIPMLVSGEAGTGKLAVARAVHHQRERMFGESAIGVGKQHAENSLVLLRASTLTGSAEQVEKELGNRLFAAAGSVSLGTSSPVVVLDDVQQLPAVAQDVICRILDQYLPGSPPRSASDAKPKYLATSPPGLDALVASGTFSPSLYSQLSAFEVICPPLRDRFADDGDSDAILTYAVKSIASALACEPVILAASDVEHIRKQHWPGNFRDLNNYMIRLILERVG